MRMIEDCVNRRKDKERVEKCEGKEREDRIDTGVYQWSKEDRYKRFELRVGLKMSHWFETVEKSEWNGN